MSMNETIDLLQKTALEKGLVVYNIHFCIAGIGIQYARWITKEEYDTITYAYYPTIEDCIREEIKRLNEM